MRQGAWGEVAGWCRILQFEQGEGEGTFREMACTSHLSSHTRKFAVELHLLFTDTLCSHHEKKWNML